MTQANILAQIGSRSGPTFRNRIINGAMVIDQRNAGASVTPANGDYTLDRWKTTLSQASKLTIQQNAGSITAPVGFTNYLGVTSSSAYSISSSDYFFLEQVIEGFNTADLNWGTANAKTITVSFWVRSSLTGTFGGAIRNNANDRAYPFTYSIPVASTWTQISITIAGDTSGTWVGATNGAGLKLDIGLGAGSTFSGTAGAWAAGNYVSATGATSVVGTNGATFYITGVQLEVGSSATGYEYRQYQQELALCQRYFFLIARGTQQAICNASYQGTGYVEGIVNFPVTMRSTPTAYVITGTNYYASLSRNTANTLNSLLTEFAGTNAASLYNTTEASGVQGYGAWLYVNNAAGAVGFQSEL